MLNTFIEEKIHSESNIKRSNCYNACIEAGFLMHAQMINNVCDCVSLKIVSSALFPLDLIILFLIAGNCCVCVLQATSGTTDQCMCEE